MQHDDLPTSEAEMLRRGLTPLPGPDLLARVSGKCFTGLFRHPFLFLVRMNGDGTLWGQNNFATQDQGVWSIDPDTGAFTVSWRNYWEPHTTRGYDDNGALHLFDLSGVWRTTFDREIAEDDLPDHIARISA